MRRVNWAWALLGGSLCLASPARAHPEMSPQLVNRYASAAILDGTLELSLVLLAGPLPARELRQKWDSDGNGAIAPAELDAARDQWARDARDWLAATLDGERLVLRPEVTIDVGANPAVDAAPVVLELRATLPVARARHELRLAAMREPDRLGETELSVVPGPDWRVAGSVQGQGPLTGRDARYLWSGSRPGGAIATFAIEPVAAASRPETKRAPVTTLLAVVAGLGALGGALVALRRRRQRSGNG